MKKQNRHFSHPHGLEPVENEEEDDDKEICCVVCEQKLSTNNETSYFCPNRDCEFYIHKSCSELPKTLDHKSHPDHKLKLLSEPPYYRIYYDCNACGDLINAFSYHCRRQQEDDESCDIKIHPKCAFLPDTVDCKAHDRHAALAIQHHTPPKSSKGSDEFDDIVSCGVCDGIVTEGYWSYFCKDCDFVTHLDCAFSADVAAEEVNEEEEEEEINEEEEEEQQQQINEEEEEINDEEETNEEGEEEDGALSDAMRLHVANIQAMEQNARLQFQMQMAEMNARAIAMLFRTTI